MDVPDRTPDKSADNCSHDEVLVHKVSHVQSDFSKARTDPSASDEVEDLFTLLDTTLQMLEPEATPPTQSEDARDEPPSAQELNKPHLSPVVEGKNDLLPAGRLADRIRALRLYRCDALWALSKFMYIVLQ